MDCSFNVIFVGPSLTPAARPRSASATWLPPIRRGDVDGLLSSGRRPEVCGIIDGEFHQSLAVSPREVLKLLDAGVHVLGSSSMGALRAAELCSFGMQGVGRIFQMYRDGEITSDDEVALCFEPESGRALSEPLVNIRCAVADLLRAGLLTSEHAAHIVEAASKLHYLDRRYPMILRVAGEALGQDLSSFAPLLRSRDQKRDDAMALCQALAQAGFA